MSLSSLFNDFAHKIVSLSLKSSNKKIINRIRLFHKFGLYLASMTRKHGLEFTVKYLKACNLAISKVIAGQAFTSLREIEPDLPLPRLSSSGLPVIIGTRDRRSIVQGSCKIIRLYLSLFSLYRIISIPGTLKLNTITDEFNGNPLFLNLIGSWFQRSQLLNGFKSKWDISSNNYLIRETASPTNSKSWVGLVREAVMITRDPVIYASFKDYCSATNSNIINLINKFEIITDVEMLKLPQKPTSQGDLGQLSMKHEAAGKIRVFAIVDGWTQSLLFPLHKSLFGILRNIPNDGTFDQGAAFERAISKAKQFNCCYGYDLSAATDRLPIVIQVKLLASLIGEQAASAWRSILVDREYSFRYTVKKGHLEEGVVKYAVGQPMGALSSWAMLALTHHMIMQYCSFQVYKKTSWETRYEVLGDDIVIFDKKLANQYLLTMELLGVPINQNKSVVAEDRPVVEFAKRTYFKEEVSPLPWKQFLSQNTFRGRINTIIGLFLKEKSFLERPFSVINIILSTRLWDSRPKKDMVAILALMNSYICSKANITYLLKLVDSFMPMITSGKLSFLRFRMEISKAVLSSLFKNETLPPLPPLTGHYLKFEYCVRETLRFRLLNMSKRYTDDWIEVQVLKHIKAVFGELYGSKVQKELSFIVRNIFFNHKINYLTLWNESIINDPKVSVEKLLDILSVKQNELSSWSYVDRIDSVTVVPEIELDISQILQLVVKGFNYQSKNQVANSMPNDLKKFLLYVRQRTNWEDLSKIKGLKEIIENDYDQS